MKKLTIAISAAVVLAAVPGLAQEVPSAKTPTLAPGISPGEISPTPEMWFYQQYRSDYEDPKMAVRRNAEFKADQRRKRLAAMKWFGFSNQRPNCTSDPFHGDWSATWRSNNSFYPSRWQGNGPAWIALTPEYYEPRTR